MNRTEILVGPGLIEPKRELVVGVERLRFEYVSRAHDRMRNIVVVYPYYSRSRSYHDVMRHETEIIDLDDDFLRFRRVLRGRRARNETRVACTRPTEHAQHCCHYH